MRLKIAGGRIIDPANALDTVGDLLIDDGRVVAVGTPQENFGADREIDAAGKIICPGFVDLSARLCEPGEEHKATILSEVRAASSAGVTTLCCPPDTTPIIDTPAVVELIAQRSVACGLSRVLPLGALTHGLQGEVLAVMDALRDAGCIGVSNARRPIADSEVLRRAFEYAATYDMTVHLVCEDHFLKNDGVVHEGAISTRLGVPAIPETAETVAVSRALLLAEQTGARVHFCRLSTARSVTLIAAAKSRGLAISADVGVAYMHLTDAAISTFNTHCLMSPPLRGERDREKLRAGLADGTITAICSDHHPHDADAKSVPFSMAASGSSTIEMLLPLTLKLVRENVISLPRAIAALTSAPAAVAGVEAGQIAVGARADVCIIDAELAWTVNGDDLVSAGKNTPFAAWEMIGKAVCTVIDGRVVYQHTTLAEP